MRSGARGAQRTRLRDGDVITFGTTARERPERASEVVYRLVIPPILPGGDAPCGEADAAPRESLSREVLMRRKKSGGAGDGDGADDHRLE